jgi:mono/diheme cytochrome c family protein
MTEHSRNKPRYALPVSMVAVLGMMVSILTGMGSAPLDLRDATESEARLETYKKDSIQSVKAFMEVYKVLMSPRCMNCHPAGDVPLQGEDSHLHAMLPQRGKDGKGVFAMKCSNCHQASNTPGLHTPPGHPDWHLPPADMKMVFEGKTPHQLAKQLMDPNQNGHKTKEQLLAHANDGLVLAGWNPGEGLAQPPMSHEAFSKAWTTWIKKGGFAPPAQ